MACEPDEDCLACESELTDCEKATLIRCKVLHQIDEMVCMPLGPVEIEGVRYETKSAALKALMAMVDWTYKLCEQSTADEGPAIEFSSAAQCGTDPCRSNWWGTCR